MYFVIKNTLNEQKKNEFIILRANMAKTSKC